MREKEIICFVRNNPHDYLNQYGQSPKETIEERYELYQWQTLVSVVMYMSEETNVRWLCSWRRMSRNSSATGGWPELIPSRGRSAIFGRCAEATYPTRHIWLVAKCKVWCVRTAKTMIYDKNWRTLSAQII